MKTENICPFMIIDLVNNLPFCSVDNMTLCDKRCREKWEDEQKVIAQAEKQA